MKKASLAVVTLLIIIGTLGIAKVPSAKASSVVNVTLYGSFSSGWGESPGSITSPGPTITVNQGDTVNLTLISQDGFTHRFYVDYDGDHTPDAGEPDSGNFDPSTVLQFTANTNGTFTYYCFVHPTVMFGTFTVTPVVPELPIVLILPALMIGLFTIAITKSYPRLQRYETQSR